MDMVINAIQQFGFPIVCVACCFWYINKTNTETREDFNKLHTTHAEEVKSLTSALSANTEVLRDLKETIKDLNHIDKEDI